MKVTPAFLSLDFLRKFFDTFPRWRGCSGPLFFRLCAYRGSCSHQPLPPLFCSENRFTSSHLTYQTTFVYSGTFFFLLSVCLDLFTGEEMKPPCLPESFPKTTFFEDSILFPAMRTKPFGFRTPRVRCKPSFISPLVSGILRLVFLPSRQNISPFGPPISQLVPLAKMGLWGLVGVFFACSL